MSTILSFVFFTSLVAIITFILTRKDDHDSSSGYFLAGRRLTATVIAGSLLLTNLSTEQMVGLNGSAYNDGLCVMVWEVVAVVALVLMAVFFLPRFLKSGIATVPQFLELRFDHATSAITNIIFLLAYAAILLPIILYTGAKGLSRMLNIGEIVGIENPTAILWLTVWLVGIIGSIYALFGGLRTVAVSDTLNGIGLLFGGFMITYFGLQAVSGNEGLFAGMKIIKEANPERFNSIGGSAQSVPFSTIFTGIILLNLFYWCTNQQIIQRTFGARNLKEGQKGVLFCALLKLLGPMYLVLPGIMAYHLYSTGVLSPKDTNDVYGSLVRHVLPPALTGFFAAVMVGAILSSFNSALNSTCTLFSLGIYKQIINKNASEHQVVRSGKILGWIIAIVSMSVAPLLQYTEREDGGGIFAYLQKMNGIYFIPIFAVVLVGMLARRVPAIAAKISLIGGVIIIALGYFTPGLKEKVDTMHEFHFIGAVFALLVVFMLIVGAIKPLKEKWVQQYSGDVNMTPWKGAKAFSIVLLILVFAIYASFADFSILKKKTAEEPAEPTPIEQPVAE